MTDTVIFIDINNLCCLYIIIYRLEYIILKKCSLPEKDSSNIVKIFILNY